MVAGQANWRDKLWGTIGWVIILGGVGGVILHSRTGLAVFKWMAIISLTPLAFLLIALIAIPVGFLASFIIYCFLCLKPGRRAEASPLYHMYGELPWWGAIIWLGIIFVSLSQVVPVILYNIGVNIGMIDGEVVSIGSSIDQSTLRGMFTAWVLGDRTLANSIVSWGIIAVSVAVLTGVGWLARKLHHLSRRT